MINFFFEPRRSIRNNRKSKVFFFLRGKKKNPTSPVVIINNKANIEICGARICDLGPPNLNFEHTIKTRIIISGWFYYQFRSFKKDFPLFI